MSQERSPGFVGVCINKQDQARRSLAQGKDSRDHTIMDIFVVIALKTKKNLLILFKKKVSYALETVSFIAIVVFFVTLRGLSIMKKKSNVCGWVGGWVRVWAVWVSETEIE